MIEPSVTLHLGDCLEWLPTLPSGSVDAVITDPPYGVDYRGRWNSEWHKIANDARLGWLREWACQLARACASDAFVCCFYGWPHADAFLAAFRAAGFRPTTHLVFIKNQIGLGYHTRGQHEQAYLFAKGSPRPSVVDSDVLPWTRVLRAEHPTQKPLDAIRPLVERFCPAGGLVLDPFMGSGTTGVACVELERRFVGCEVDPSYHAVAARRIAAAQNRHPLFWPSPASQLSLFTDDVA